MLIWSGNGFVLPLLVSAMVAIGLVGGERLGVADYHAAAIGFLLAAAATWIIGRRMNDPAKGDPLIDTKTGETVIFRERHTVFWIEVQWWAVACIMAAIGSSFRNALFPDGADPWPTVFVLAGLELGGMVLGQHLARPKPSPPQDIHHGNQ